MIRQHEGKYETNIRFTEYTPKQVEDIEELQQLADDMAGCATAMSTHNGYACFIAAREKFRQRLKEMASLYVRIDFT